MLWVLRVWDLDVTEDENFAPSLPKERSLGVCDIHGRRRGRGGLRKRRAVTAST